jgi:hypothetical protein
MGLSPNGSMLVASRGGVLWDSGVVAAGAEIVSPVLDVSCLAALLLAIDNTGAGTAALSMKVFLDDGTTDVATIALRTVASGAKELGTIGQFNAAVGTAPALQFALGIPLPTKVQFTLPTAGSNRRVTIFGR